jgi:tetratricopeptide (TPR) repeat protein
VSRTERSAELYEAGWSLLDAGDVPGAIERFQESIQAAPHYKTLELLGECFLKSGRLREAVVPLAAAATLNKGVRAPAILAEVFLALEQYDDAAEMAELALHRDPKNRRALAVMRAAVTRALDRRSPARDVPAA